MEDVWLYVAVGAGIFGLLGGWIAGVKGRSPAEGFLLGALFGPLGALIEALMPAPSPKDPSADAAFAVGSAPGRPPQGVRKPPGPVRPRKDIRPDDERINDAPPGWERYWRISTNETFYVPAPAPESIKPSPLKRWEKPLKPTE